MPGIFYPPTPSVHHLGSGLEGLWGQALPCYPITNYGFHKTKQYHLAFDNVTILMYYSIQAIHGGNQQMSYQFEQASCGFFCKCSNILGKAEGMNACRLAWQAATPSESKFKSGFWQNISPLRSLTTLLMVSGSCQRTQILLTSLMQVWQFQSPYLWSKGEGLEMISKAT